MREIISVAQMFDIDGACPDAGVPTRTLMDNAGRAVADAVITRFAPCGVAVLCGPGNNGGDGWVAARCLKQNGWEVRVESLVDPSTLHGDAAEAARAFIEAGGEVLIAPRARPTSLYIDALFGAGLSRPLEGEAARMAEALSAAPEKIVAIDVPSGLDGDSGKPRGETCFRAGLTVTFVRKKPAHVLAPGRDYCGDIVVADIGAPEEVVARQDVKLWENDPALWASAFPWPKTEAHKHERGQVFVASGGRGRTGAGRMAARGALRIGAGLVTLVSPFRAVAENSAHLTAIMLHAVNSPNDYSDIARSADCFVIGPAFGLEERHSERMHAARTTQKRGPMVFDADALTLLGPIKAPLQPRDVLTPHVGEFKRCFPQLLEKSASRIEAARTAAKRAGCAVLLKGPDTVIAAADGRAIVNTTGTPFLATAGSGDVLAGMIGGLIGQGMASFEAAAAAAWLHGRTAEALGAGLIAEDLPEQLTMILDHLAPSRLKRRFQGE